MSKKEELKRLIDAAKRRISAVDVNKLNKIIEKENNSVKKNDSTRIVRTNYYNKQKVVKSVGSGLHSINNKPRPDNKFLTKVNGKFFKIEMPQKGAFNAAIIRLNEEKIICVYRSDEYHFTCCYLDNDYKVINKSFYNLKIRNCSDPRLIWLENNKLLLVYSSVNNVSHEREYICGTIIMEDRNSGNFVDTNEFRISHEHMHGRQKNWMPFMYNNSIYLISSVCPHEVYHLNEKFECHKAYTTQWNSPWEIKEHHRGNTNAVLMGDGNYLCTFHTSSFHHGKHYYDNGSYIFSGNPPFNVLKCSNRTYLPAEAACEKHFRKENEIVCNFPVGMMLENNKVIISYGDNDSVVKIVEYKIEDFLNTMIDV